ncbi:MAG: VOC family protein [Myxococcales bacterium]|nr:VOC family protein [Myxococcales bacterium]
MADAAPAPRPRFHLAFPVDDLARARTFYEGVLGATVGRTSDRWIDFRFWDHQITAHLCATSHAGATNEVDQDDVPVRHFGVILEWDAWEALASRLQDVRADFVLEPKIRFVGQPGEQATFFVRDPAGNALEFKAFRDDADVFRSEPR